MKKETKLTLAALGDLHVKQTIDQNYESLLSSISQEADILLLCGDLTDLGLPEEAHNLVKVLSSCTIPIVAVLGNHDFESGKEKDVAKILAENKIHVLDGNEFVFEKDGKKYGFTGVKGFGGGFRPNMWGRFGEKEQKEFYDAVATEVQQLENGLNRLQSLEVDHMIVLLHFSPIRETLQGEVEELYAFLGSTRLEEVIDRYPVDLVFHAHAHHGNTQGKTAKTVPVYNVALPLLQRLTPNTPYALVEL